MDVTECLAVLHEENMAMVKRLLRCGCYVERNMSMLKVTCSVCGKEQHSSESNPTGWFAIHHGGRQIHRLCSYSCLMEAVLLEMAKNRKGELQKSVLG